MKTKCTVFLLFILYYININGQENWNIEFIFKMQLFNDLSINAYSTDEVYLDKTNILFTNFISDVDIKLDTLKSQNINNDYHFFFLRSANLYLDTSKNNNFEWMIAANIDTYYILCINIKTQFSYRLAGFNGNDFLNFMSDYREYHNLSNLREYMSDKQFLMECTVEKIDFNCLYKGLHDKNWNRNKYPDKYPCLKRVSDPIITNCYFY